MCLRRQGARIWLGCRAQVCRVVFDVNRFALVWAGAHPCVAAPSDLPKELPVVFDRRAAWH